MKTLYSALVQCKCPPLFIVWLTRLSLSAQGRKEELGRDGLAYIAITSYLAA